MTTGTPPHTDPTALRVRTALHDQLRGLRAHVLDSLDGLDDDALRRVVLPSGWTPLGLVRHLTVDDERFWFTTVIAGRGDPEPVDGWQVGPEESAAAVIAAYRAECERSDAVIASLPLDAPLGWWPDGLFGNYRPADLLAVLNHMITETALHAGHLDVVRELIDGRQSLVLD